MQDYILNETGYQIPTFEATSTLPCPVDYYKKIGPLIKVTGYIYVYTCTVAGPDFNKKYVGATDDSVGRRYDFQEQNNKEYAGYKINKARETYGTGDDAWDYKILIYVHDSLNHKETLDSLEVFGIALFDCYYHGFNSNLGGSGRGPTAVTVTNGGTTAVYCSVKIAAETLQVSQSTIYNHRRNSTTTRGGYQFS